MLRSLLWLQQVFLIGKHELLTQACLRRKRSLDNSVFFQIIKDTTELNRKVSNTQSIFLLDQVKCSGNDKEFETNYNEAKDELDDIIDFYQTYFIGYRHDIVNPEFWRDICVGARKLSDNSQHCFYKMEWNKMVESRGDADFSSSLKSCDIGKEKGK